MTRDERPAHADYPEYYRTYVDKVPEGDIVTTLERQVERTLRLLGRIGEQGAGHRYAPGKWSVKQVAQHVCDAERVFAYRALVFARGDATPLPGFAENDWAASGRIEHRKLADVADELVTLRRSNLALFGGFDDETLSRRGSANGVEFTVGSLAWIVAGHELHHAAVLEERYLPGLA